MVTYKSKSLTPELTDFQIENGTHTIQFEKYHKINTKEIFK